MATITEDYVSFETAKLLKEKGFDSEEVGCHGGFYSERCYHSGYGIITDSGQEVGIVYDDLRNADLEYDEYLRPTLQMAMKWLREVHNMHIMVNCVGKVNYDPIVQGFDGKDYEIEGVEVSSTRRINDKWMVVRRGFKTNELAVEAAIKYCLEHLI